jgi:glycosyltransferase involved in cell wall biosynthesis
MNIGIIAPCAVPFVVGGAENLYWGLENYINTHTTHAADIIKLPSPENDFWSLMGSYRQFSALDLSGFDSVLSCKYPTWMVRHPRHLVYLQHKLRGLYDTYAGSLEAPKQATDHIGIRRILDAADRLASGKDDEPARLFDAVETVAYREDADEMAAVAFPGPIARCVIHALDDYAMASRHIHKYAAISQEVAKRQDYFPEKARVQVRHHPTGMSISPGKQGDYLFTASRLDGPKRIALLIEAMRYVTADITLKIAGTGPEEAMLKQKAAQDERIEMLGYVADWELERLYANALGVLFVPFKEDYGLITLEAMLAGKPVITTSDSGGPTELISTTVNGWITEPQPRAIAVAIDELADDRARAHAMGKKALQRARAVSWAPLVDWITS